VIVGALVIILTGWQYADPIISLGIAAQDNAEGASPETKGGMK